MQLTDIFGNQHNLSPGQQPAGIYDATVASFEDVSVFGPHGAIFDRNGDLVPDTFWTTEQSTNYRDSANGRFWKLIPRARIESAVALPLYWSSCYYHWMCDVLPRLSLLPQASLHREHFLVPYPFKSWMAESLHLLGISADQCIPLKGRFAYKIRRLKFPQKLSMTGDHNPTALAWLRKQMLSKVDTRSNSNHTKLYITRRSATQRRLINESTLIKKLLPLGFSIIAAESLPFIRQIEIFSQAKVIVAPHGSGLSNSLLAKENGQIIEIMEPQIIRRCYATLSKTLGLNHRCVLGETVENRKGDPDIHLDTNSIEKLNQFLSTFN